MIYCIGDSFTAGDELPDWPEVFDPYSGPYPSSQLAWPAVLGQQLNKPVTNLGRGACGNTRIVKRAIDSVTDGAELVIVAWTNPERIELADSTSIFDIWGARNINKMQVRDERDQLVKWSAVNQTNYQTNQWFYTNWLRQIILLQSFFKTYDQKYIMLCSHVGNNLNQQHSDKFSKLYNLIDQTHFLGWPNLSMLDWTYGCPQGPGGHFLEQGHRIVADKINEHIRNIGWLP